MYKLVCPKCGTEDCIITEASNASCGCTVGIDSDFGGLEYSDHTIYDGILHFNVQLVIL